MEFSSDPAEMAIRKALYQAMFALSLIDGARVGNQPACLDVKDELAALYACLCQWGIDLPHCARMMGTSAPAKRS